MGTAIFLIVSSGLALSTKHGILAASFGTFKSPTPSQKASQQNPGEFVVGSTLEIAFTQVKWPTTKNSHCTHVAVTPIAHQTCGKLSPT